MKLDIQTAVPLAPFTTLKVGGEAELFVTVTTDDELSEALTYARENHLPITILGGGSNVLIADGGVPGLVIYNQITGRHTVVEGDNIFLTVSAGEVLDDVVADTVTEGWWGLENLSHIPGSIGAVPIQNVGAYGVEAKDVVTAVEVRDMNSGTAQTLAADECGFGYRDSIFKHQAGSHLVVVAVTFRLHKKPQPMLEYRDLAERFPSGSDDQAAIRNAVIDIRSHKFPNWHEVGTAGSFFKNPIISKQRFDDLKQQHPELPGFVLPDGRVKIALGYVLDKICQLRGHGDGNVATYHNQALVIIQNGAATAHEITVFAKRIVSIVKDRTGIEIEWEVTPIGERP